MLRSPGQGVDISDALVKRDGELGFPETEGGFYLQCDSEDETGTAETANGRDEEVVSVVTGARDAGTVCEQEGESDDMGGNDAVMEAGSVGRGGDDAAECLVGDGADVDHGEAVLSELDVEGVEGDAGLDDDVAFLDVDLACVRACNE